MIHLLRQLNLLFNTRERWQLVILAVALVVRAGVEMLGVGSIAPFMSVVADPSVIQRNEWLLRTYELLGFTSTTGFLTALGVLVVVVVALSNMLSALAIYGMLRFSWGTHHRLSNRLLRGYLAQPYSFFVERNSASFSKTILSEVQQVISGVLTPVLNIVSRCLVVVAITTLLVLLDPMLALVTVFILGGAYGCTYLLVKSRQRRLGRKRVTANEHRYKLVGEVFGGIKDVKVLERETAFASRFAPPSWAYSRASASNAAAAALPRYLLEGIAFGGVVLIVLYYLQSGEGLAQILPTVSLYAFAGYRLMPELQQLYAAVAAIRFNRASLDDLTQDLNRFPPTPLDEGTAEPLAFNETIRFEEVTFRYQKDPVPALDSISLTIRRNQTIGLVGASGSGKTTLVDLLLGLYPPEAGQIRVDNGVLSSRTVSAWRRQLGYVPQHIFLCDDTIANNIAFGVPPGAVDRARVERAARIAHLDDFIQSLPRGYETLVGERGVRLSGGQRQRIGIARALYHDPDVLIMDEATSALDGATEAAVMDAINDLAGHKTIILIAHRLSTIEKCDCIYVLDHGRVTAHGAYEALLAKSKTFRALAKIEPGVPTESVVKPNADAAPVAQARRPSA